jgi:hypothetical protein
MRRGHKVADKSEQCCLEQLEIFPGLCVRALPSILDNLSINLILLRLIHKEIIELHHHIHV